MSYGSLVPQSPTKQLVLSNAQVVLPNAVVELAAVWIEEGVIRAVVPQTANEQPWPSDATVVDCQKAYVTPGMIDPHVNGAYGVAFNNADAHGIQRLLTQLAPLGVTAILPTLISATKLSLVKQMAILEGLMGQQQPTAAKMLGIHLEGPFLSPQYRGAHPEEAIIPPTRQDIDDLLSPNLKRMTIAPEQFSDSSLIQHLIQRGVACSMGHSAATASQASQAIAAGVDCATHLFNAMRPFHQREVGILGVSLLDPELYIELIADGVHVAKEALELALRLKPLDKIILTTDSNPLTGLSGNQTVAFGALTLKLEQGQSLSQEGRLAGSHITLAQQVHHLVTHGLLRFEQAIQACTVNPARYLKVENYIGQIKLGCIADLILWHPETLNIEQVLLSGTALPANTATVGV